MAETAHAVLVAMRDGAARASYDELPARTLAVAPVGARGVAYAGADSDGFYTLAIAAVPHGVTPPPIEMAALSVDFGVRYLLDQQGVRDDVRVTILRCNSVDAEVRELFGSFSGALLDALPDVPRETDIAAEMDKWLGLFWRLQAPARTDVVGLIGELTMLRVAPNPSAWVRAWHRDPASTVDFVVADPAVEVEVKATQSATRTHTLSGDQAFGIGNRYFASVHVDLRDSGDTIGNFVREVADDLDVPDDRRRFWNILAGECGSAFTQLMAERFVWQRSTGSIAFFRRDEVPRPDLTYPLPPSVTGLRFRSDFSSSPWMSAGEFFESLGDIAVQG
ncbi:MAG TPA: PD-(D/E)XK motif protein [Nocardioidaceae bacterium]|nr:PD-(D/E)XK motif protein [Nocardioidaceae bacterium]